MRRYRKVAPSSGSNRACVRSYRTRITLLCMTLSLTACTMSQLTSTVTAIPGKTGFSNSLTFNPGPRWRLPNDAQVILAIPHDSWIPANWQQAARRGLQQAFPANTGARYTLSIQWPDSERSIPGGERRRVESRLFGIPPIPTLNSTMTFTATLFSGDGAFVHRAQVHWRPGVQHSHWNSPEALEEAVFQLGLTYLGGSRS